MKLSVFKLITVFGHNLDQRYKILIVLQYVYNSNDDCGSLLEKHSFKDFFFVDIIENGNTVFSERFSTFRVRSSIIGMDKVYVYR